LKEGFARCVDWSMGVVTQGAENLRAAEKYVSHTNTWITILTTGLMADGHNSLFI